MAGFPLAIRPFAVGLQLARVQAGATPDPLARFEGGGGPRCLEAPFTSPLAELNGGAPSSRPYWRRSLQPAAPRRRSRSLAGTEPGRSLDGAALGAALGAIQRERKRLADKPSRVDSGRAKLATPS